MLELRRLRLLRELKLRGTLAAVALAMNQTPSSISQQLTQLEREVGAVLLRKVGRRVQLTDQAEILVEHTELALEQLEQAEANVAASMNSVTGKVRIAVFQSAALALMPRTLADLDRQYPELRVEFVQREPDLAEYETWARDFDLVVTQQYPGDLGPQHPELDFQPLGSDAIRIGIPYSGSPWGNAHSLTDLASARWAMEPRGVRSRVWAEQVCADARFAPKVPYVMSDLQAQVELVEAGMAVAFIPDLYWRGRPATVRLLDIDTPARRKVFTSVRRGSITRPAIAAVREALKKAAINNGNRLLDP